MSPQRARYDLLAVNLTVAAISAVLMAAVGSSVKVVQLLDKSEIAGVEVSLAVGAAVNPGILVAAVTIFFAISAAICCTWHNRLLHLAQPFGRGKHKRKVGEFSELGRNLHWAGVFHGRAGSVAAQSGRASWSVTHAYSVCHHQERSDAAISPPEGQVLRRPDCQAALARNDSTIKLSTHEGR